MGRPERPLDPGAGPVQRFAYELRKLRGEAEGPTYRTMAAGGRYSAPTLSAAASGERLPTLPVALAYVAACGGDLGHWEQRWREAAAADEPAPDDTDTVSPYPGLARVEAGGHFFGRADLVAELTELTARRRFVAVVGASGSGKSSLLRAGLIPVLRTADGPRPAAIRVLTPGGHPVRTHAPRITAGGGQDGSADSGGTVVVVDQFEELFTLCHDPSERAEFISLLLTGGARVVVAVRADFYGRCAEHRALASALRDATLLVGPMSRAQLREAVVGPATAERLIVERSLTARIVADVADEPGGLPLMAHALREVWRRRRGRTLTVAAYEAVGGVRGAIAHTAEEVYSGFTADRARTARALLLRLISPGDGTQDTRRPVTRTELGTSPETAAVLEQLVGARLLTAGTTTVELAHEALISSWPRLRGWIEEDRERLRLHRQLTDAARAWEELGRDPGALYRGMRLASARDAFGAGTAAPRSAGPAPTASYPSPPGRTSPGPGPSGLTATERDFLSASLDGHDSALRAAARTTRRLRALTVTLAVLLCVAVVAGLTVGRQSRIASRHAAEAEARRVAAAVSVLRTTDPRAAMRLSVAAWRIADLPETRSALYGAAAQRDLDVFGGPSAEFAADNNDTWRRTSTDGRTLTVIGPGRTDRWDITTHRRLPSYAGLGAYAKRITAVSPDTRTAAVSVPGGLRMWDLAAGRLTGRVFGGAGKGPGTGWFTANGRAYAVSHYRRDLQLWDPRAGRPLLTVPEPRDEVRAVQVSPDGRLMAYCAGGPLQVWDVPRHRKVPVPWAARDLCDTQDFVFTPDSAALAFTMNTATAHGALRTWDVRSGHERPRVSVPGLSEAEFSPDGAYAATLTDDAVQLWRLADPARPVLRTPARGSGLAGLTLDMAHRVLRYEESGGGAHAVHTVALDSAVGVDWHPKRAPRRRPGPVKVTGPRGQTLNSTRELTDPRTGRTTRVMRGEDVLDGAAFGPDGRHLAMSDMNGRVTLWNGSGTRLLAVLALGVPSSGAVPGWHVPALAFSADGRRVAVGDKDGGLRMWDTADPDTAGAELPPVDGPVLALAFTHDGSGLRVTTPHTPSRAVELRPARAAAAVCARAAGGLSRAQWRTYLPSVAYRSTCGER
ncbi:hypothetical protein [Streptomyces sp. NBC_00859]|uniref:nSTAND1 domain-containing NTPase n=1 Tax=Streptomyces sp. NBC_00859 TaxID=2903682 RepID=UPI0038706D80|nr:hypothetical protein OG584_15610 [Streptomyces sp. NBC_00859]